MSGIITGALIYHTYTHTHTFWLAVSLRREMSGFHGSHSRIYWNRNYKRHVRYGTEIFNGKRSNTLRIFCDPFNRRIHQSPVEQINFRFVSNRPRSMSTAPQSPKGFRKLTLTQIKKLSSSSPWYHLIKSINKFHKLCSRSESVTVFLVFSFIH